jgi:universal stress protein E
MRVFDNTLYIVGDSDGLPGLKRALALTNTETGSISLVSIIESIIHPIGSSKFYTELKEAFEALRHERLAMLEKLANSVPKGISVTYEVMDGRSYVEAIKRVLLYKHDLVVANAADSDHKGNRLFVSEEMQLLRKCPCPVLLLKSSQAGPFKRVLATLDFEYYDTPDTEQSEPTLNDEILEVSATIASEAKGKLDIINVYEIPGEGAMTAGWIPMNINSFSDYANSCAKTSKDKVDMQVKRSKHRLGTTVFDQSTVETHIVHGRARSTIPEVAETLKTDLIVMGTVGRAGTSGLLLGNTAETILNHIDCSVLALKPPGFETPISLD